MDPRDLANRDLLIGLLALQTGMVDQDVLIAAFRTSTRDKSRPIAEILAAQGAIDSDDLAVLDALAVKHLKRHGGDAERSLAALNAGRSTRESLARIGDSDIEATLARVGSGSTEPDRERTATYAPGSATADGQRFRVLRPHARGGLGEVFVALDEELHREVALKQILDHHADDPTSRTRFVLEAEITGGLEHPGIVPVYGLGSYGDGRPYYAMRFVRGDSLKDAIAAFHADESLKADPGKRSLALRMLLRRFVDVCNAIDYAHTRGVLHRDIKPANVIVGKHGETLVVDWGLAKVMGRSESGSTAGERTLMPSSARGSAETLPGSAMGTPSYMSPEQASGDLDHLGARSDVHSLGATLYCLLTSKPPFEGDDVGAVLRAVQRGEFPPPRTTEPSLDRAMEAVCLKAMALKPEDRYPTPRALADDVERWMADEPVSAWREPFSRRLRRRLQRHRTVATASAAAGLVALVGLLAILGVQGRANHQLKAANLRLRQAIAREAAANQELSRATDRTVRANRELVASNVRERARLDVALEAVRTFHTGVSEDLLLTQPQLRGLRDRLLEGALSFYGKLEDLLRGQGDRRSRSDLARAYYDVAQLTDKIGPKDRAVASHRRALAMRRELADGADADDAARVDLADSLLGLGRVVSETGGTGEAEASLKEARSLLDAVVHAGPRDPRARLALARSHREFGDLLSKLQRMTQARDAYRQSLRAGEPSGEGPDDPGLRSERAQCYNSLGWLQVKLGDPGAARESFAQALQLRRGLARDRPGDEWLCRSLGSSYLSLGFSLGLEGRYEGARAAYLDALGIYEPLMRARPAEVSLQVEVARCYDFLGMLLSDYGTAAEALAAHRRALGIRQGLASLHPSVVGFQIDRARSEDFVAILLAQLGHVEEALAAHRGALEARREIVHANPGALKPASELGWSHHNLGYLLGKVGRVEEALAAHREALTIRRQLVSRSPESVEIADELIDTLRHLGTLLVRADRAAEAIVAFREAIALSESRRPAASGLYVEARLRAQLARAAAMPRSGASECQDRIEADRAIGALRRAIAAGFRDSKRLATDFEFDTLRDREDFRLLAMDLGMPADPFAKER